MSAGTRVEHIDQLWGDDGIDGGYCPVSIDGKRTAEAERERDELRERFETERRRAIQAETALIARGE